MIDDQPRRRVPWFGVVGLVLLATLVAAVFVQVRQYVLLTQSVEEQDDFTVLSLYQLEVEYLRLVEQLHRAQDDAQPSNLAEVQLRYDIFLSRVDLLQGARMRKLLEGLAGSAATLRKLETFVSHGDIYLGANPRGPLSQSAAAALVAEFEPLSTPIHQLLIDATHRVAAQITARREQVRHHNNAGLLLTGFLSAMVLLFGALALRQMRQLERRRSHLETLAAELRIARTTAEVANQAKGAFLADMSHELRTPLHGLRGMLDLLGQTPHDPRGPQWLATAAQSAAHLQRLLDDVLDLSKLDSNTLELAPQAVELSALVHETCALMLPEAQAKALQLDVGLDAELPRFVHLDPTRTRQVLFNLLHNAIKYTERGAVTLRCRPSMVGDGAAQIEFIVSDNGIGMHAQAVERLFGRFVRGDDPLARRQGGTGLGLAISRRLARLMGGDIEAASTPGEGSVFTFRCQLLPAAEPITHPAPAPAAQSSRRLSVLVVEDHPVNRVVLGTLLERLGHQTRHVEHGAQALQAVREAPFDLVLMDVHMPIMDGVAAAEAIRAMPGLAQPRIVALTADVFAETRGRCLSAGIDEVLTKPLGPEALGALLQRLFGVVPPATQQPAGQPQPVSASPLKLLDHDAQAGLREVIGAQRIRALYLGLFQQADDTAQQMQAAARQADAEALKRLAHSFKGASLNLGLPALAEAAGAISRDAHAMAFPQMDAALQRFDELLNATRLLCMAEGLIAD